MSVQFSHNFPINAPMLLSYVGISRKTNPMEYETNVSRVQEIIMTEVLASALTLQLLLIVAYQKDMGMLQEYADFPRYLSAMSNAIYNQSPSVYYDEMGNAQARFIDTDKFGNLSDLASVQRAAYAKSGTTAGWAVLYTLWQQTGDSHYEDTVNKRLDLLMDANMFPYWILIENGNGPQAFPQNPPMRTLSNFNFTYINEMNKAYNRCLFLVKSLIYGREVAGKKLKIVKSVDTVYYNGESYAGEKWISSSGNVMFLKYSGKPLKVVAGRVVAEGFNLDAAGIVTGKWNGWLPTGFRFR